MSRRVTTASIAFFSLVVATITASIADGAGSSWTFRSTGHMANVPSTAIAMRDGLTWPVIFAPESGMLKAISLFPVQNIETQTGWHEIGESLLPFSTSLPRIHAASSSEGEFAAACRYDSQYGNALVGSSRFGISTLAGDIFAVDYDLGDNLVALSANTLPLSPGMLVDIDSSISGTIGVLSGNGNNLIYYQTSPLLGGWSEAILPAPQAEYMRSDLALDSLGRPHVAGVSAGNVLFVNDYDIVSETWTTTYLDGIGSGLISAPTIVSDNLGGVGLVWVSNSGTLKYAYKNGRDPWSTQVVATGVYDSILDLSDIVRLVQTPGLAFDADDLPVISFVSNLGKIWIAYDPPVPVPEPSTIFLLASGLLAAAWLRIRKS